MRITGNDYVTSLQNLQQVMNNGQLSTGTYSSSNTSSSDSIKAEFSPEGRRMSSMMQRMGRMDSEEMESQMVEMKSDIDELGISDMDLDTMSDDEISELASQVQDVLDTYKPEHVGENGFSVEDMSSDDQREFLSTVQENSQSVLSAIGKMGQMAQGKPPGGGGRPPQGGGGMQQNAISSYQSMSTSTEDSELSMIESFLDALESDDDDDSDYSSIYQAIGDYLTVNI